MMHHLVLCGFVLTAFGLAPVAARDQLPIEKLGETFDLLGRTHQPIGTALLLRGKVVRGPDKGYEGGPNLLVQVINGKATQEYLRLPIQPYFREFGDGDLPKIEIGRTYELKGYESGSFVGVPDGIGASFQTTGFYFRPFFAVSGGKETPPVRFTPADFVNRRALFEGKAVTREGKALVAGEGWTIVTNERQKWPDWMEGQTAEVLGVIRPTADPRRYRVENAQPRLVRLEDQVGRVVELRGSAGSVNGEWWFDYRGQRLYVDELEKRPGFLDSKRHDALVIRGKLELVMRHPPAEHEKPVTHQFLIRNPEWRALDEPLLAPERPEIE